MIIGIPKEIKPFEYRIASVPSDVKRLVENGHRVLVESCAGLKSGFADEEYRASGADIVDKEEVYTRSDMIYKVKEFFPEEFKYFREGLVVFTYIHSNAHEDQTQAMINSKIIGVSYEDIEVNGTYPLLRPMSEIAGKGGFLAAAQYMQSINGGPGLLLNDIAGQHKPVVAIIGAGTSGVAAAELALAFNNHVILLDINHEALLKAKEKFDGKIETLISNDKNIHDAIRSCDVLMNCINWPKWRKDHLVTRSMLKQMKSSAMIVDVACDEGGAIETCVATNHGNPTYVTEGILHYCVDNIPSAFSRSASLSLSNATIQYALEIANKGAKKSLIENKNLRKGLSFYHGHLTLEETGRKLGLHCITPEEALGIF